jgi:hypothetical protein
MIILFVLFLIYAVIPIRKKSPTLKNDLFKIFSIAFLFLIWIAGFILGDTLEYLSRKELKGFISPANEVKYLTINSIELNNPNQFLHDLMTISKKHCSLGGSHMVDTFKVEIKKRNSRIILVMGRDSYCQDEFWVFMPQYKHTSRNDIGRVKTKIFDELE